MPRLRVVVLGYLVRGPLGGLAWHHLQYVDGLARLGHDVWFAEIGDAWPSCYDPRVGVVDDPSYGLAFAADAFARLGAPGWAYHDARTCTWVGPAADAMADVLATADIVLNVSGVNDVPEVAAAVPVRAFIDTDPVFTQGRHRTDAAARARAAQHTAWFSFGERVACERGVLPDDGFDWRPTRQPVSLTRWPVSPVDATAAFTTVMQWESYRPVVVDGVEYGTKSRSFPPYADLPSRTPATLELALGGETAPREELATAGWRLADPLAVTLDPWTFQSYLQASAGELSVAKHAYVASRSGWFSERSANYLASGRPVITQDTGFSELLPVGEGLLAFRDPEEAVDALARVRADHGVHAAAARAIAEEHFRAERVLQHLIDQL